MNQEIPNCFYRISIKALIFDKDKKFLLAKEDAGLWDLPGGGIDFGEKPKQCLEREIYEEMGLKTTFVAENPSYFLTSKNKDGVDIAQVIYEARVEDLNFRPSGECVEIKFFTKDEAMQEVNVFLSVLEFLKLYRQ